MTKRAKQPKHPHRGSCVDDWLKEEGIFEAATQKAIKEVIAWNPAQRLRQYHHQAKSTILF